MTIEDLQGIVHSDPEIMGGTPVFVGTRVPLQNLVDALEGGESIEDFLEGFPAPIEDGVSFSLLDGSEYKPTEELSTGQRCTVVLPLLLKQHNLSLILDQPEDHLDNGFIVDTLNIRGHFAIRQRAVEMLRASFADGQAANAVKVFVFDGDIPAPARFILFLGNDVFHHVLPGPRGQFGIGGVQIYPRQTEAASAFVNVASGRSCWHARIFHHPE